MDDWEYDEESMGDANDYCEEFLKKLGAPEDYLVDGDSGFLEDIGNIFVSLTRDKDGWVSINSLKKSLKDLYKNRFSKKTSVKKVISAEEEFNKCVEGSWKINSKGKIDVNGDVDLYFVLQGRTLLEFCRELGATGFGRVSGNFNCNHNKLKILTGSPSYVGKDFSCELNELESLEGGPRLVLGSYNCGGYHLISLNGSPKKVGKNFDCSWGSLTSLLGSPEYVGGDFDCIGTRMKITDLKGCPKVIKGDFKTSNDFTPKDLEKVCNLGGRFRKSSYS